jgi:hypothetical protein
MKNKRKPHKFFLPFKNTLKKKKQKHKQQKTKKQPFSLCFLPCRSRTPFETPQLLSKN